MTGSQVIEEIKRLPKEERAKVLEFTRQIGENCRLPPEELGRLAKRMVETDNSAEAERLQVKIIRGFYGSETHA